MRPLLTVLMAAAIVGIAAGVARGFTAYYGAIYLSNIQTPNSSTNPHATTNGLVWIDTGAGPVLNQQDIDMQLLCGPTTGTALAPMQSFDWLNGDDLGPQYSTILLGTAAATGDVTNLGKGDFCGQGPSNNEWVSSITAGCTQYSTFNYQLCAWTGLYSTYAAAYIASAQGAAGVYVGQTPVFGEDDFINDTKNQAPQAPGDLDLMPALLLSRGLPGDANLDGRVDINDLTIVLSSFGQSGIVWSQGDFNGDGRVDINDLTIVLAHFGATLGTATAGGMAAVPEPSVLALLAAALIGIFVAYGSTRTNTRSRRWPRDRRRRSCN